MKHWHHIIPRHAGGSDDPSNLVHLTPEEHAFAHKKLWEDHGRWQDYVAWQGLAKLASKEDLIRIRLSEAGKKGNRLRGHINGLAYNTGKKYNTQKCVELGARKGAKNPCARTYEVTHPDGTVEEVRALKTWCEERSLNYNTFHTMCVLRNKEFKGYTAAKK